MSKATRSKSRSIEPHRDLNDGSSHYGASKDARPPTDIGRDDTATAQAESDPGVDQRQRADIREVMIRAVAEKLWREHGGNATLNWLEAEALVNALTNE